MEICAGLRMSQENASSQALGGSSHVNKLLLSKQGQQSDKGIERDMSRALRSSAPGFKAGKSL